MLHPMVKMIIALVAIITMFLANIFILTARNKLKGVWKILLSITAFILLLASFIMIIIVVFSV